MKHGKAFRKLYGRPLLYRLGRPFSFLRSNMKRAMIGFVLVGVLGVGMLVGANTLGTSRAQDCPNGTYNINTSDEPICKPQPTGCPYGDSVPMEKCEPQTPEEKAVVEPAPVISQPVEEAPSCR